MEHFRKIQNELDLFLDLYWGGYPADLNSVAEGMNLPLADASHLVAEIFPAIAQCEGMDLSHLGITVFGPKHMVTKDLFFLGIWRLF